MPPRFSYGTEGILQLLCDIDPKFVNSHIVLGISSILPEATIAKTDPLVMRHVVIVFDSLATAEKVLSVLRTDEVGSGHKEASTTQAYLRERGCTARTV